MSEAVNDPTRSGFCQGVTEKKQPCTRSGGSLGFCYQHVGKAGSAILASPNADPAIDAAQLATRVPKSSRSGLCQGVNAKKKPCGLKAGCSGFCTAHVDQAGSAILASREREPAVDAVRLATPEPESKRSVRCRAVNCGLQAVSLGFCDLHVNQATENQAVQHEASPRTPSPRSVPPTAQKKSGICPHFFENSGKPCTYPAKVEYNGFCGKHKNQAGKQASVALAPSTPSPGVRTETAGQGFGIDSAAGKGKKKETKITGRRGAMAEVLKICRTEDINDSKK
jgi:hypothetical protein